MGSFMVRLDDDLHAELRAHAADRGVPMAECIRFAVIDHLAAEPLGCAHPTVVATTGGWVCAACKETVELPRG